MKIHPIYIIIIIAILLFGYFGRKDYEDKISFLEDEREIYIDRIEDLFIEIKERDGVIEIIRGDLSISKEEIDSLKTLEHEIKTPNYSDIPVDERNLAIERLASEE